jgi:glycosyltransferase involved in cell wall biosynthesis
MTSTVAVLSFSPIARDQRVLRQCGLLRDMGHPPRVIGFGDEGDAIAHDFRRYPVPRPTVAHRISTLVRRLPSHLGLPPARLGFWAARCHRWAYRELQDAKPRVIIANDWPALVVAARYKGRFGGTILYDTHEFATREREDSAWWRLVYKPMVTHLEAAAIAAADAVCTVGPSLAARLRELYALKTMPAVIRSVPAYVPPTAPINCCWPLRVLYHGHLMPGRGLEALIDSVELWQTPHRLIVRGDGAPRYVAALKDRAARAGIGARVTFERAVPAGDVISRAAETADVGVFFTPLESGQQTVVLPNKLFEYIGAGLAVAVSPAPDMKSLVEEHGVGVVSADATPEAIAACLNGLDQERVAAFKSASRRAAALLCWENECAVLRRTLRHCLGDETPSHCSWPSQPETADQSLSIQEF